MAVFLSRSRCPFRNLAAEEWLFRAVRPEESPLLLYTNERCVVLGRYQNPFQECDLALARKTQTAVVRRRSGGGTVFHDPGNLNVCLFSTRAAFNRASNAQFLRRALNTLLLGVEGGESPLQLNERNDLTLRGRKISGSAYRIVSDRAYHHATFLISADLESLRAHLRAPKRRIVGRWTESVRSPVTNISSPELHVSVEDVIQALTDQYRKEHGHVKVHELSDEFLASEPKVQENEALLKSWDWRFGQTPPFTHTLGLPDKEIVIGVEDGLVHSLSLTPTSPSTAGNLLAFLKGRRYDELLAREGAMEIPGADAETRETLSIIDQELK